MAKSADEPKNIEDFWKIYQKDKKKLNWKTALQIITIIVAVSAIIVSYLVAIGWIQNIEESNVIADERISRNLYELTFHNNGKIENGLQIEIWFGDYKIDSSQLSPGVLQLVYNDTTYSDTGFVALYSSINENQEFNVYIHLINDSTEKISPIYVRAWTNKGEVKINRDNE